MSLPEDRLTAVVADLRGAFDRAFAEPERGAAPAAVDFLEIRVAEQAYLLRLEQVASLHAERKLVRVPSPRPELLGLFGLRGSVVPTYHLGRLLGRAAGLAPRWVAVARAPEPFAIAFEHFEAYLRLPLAGVVTAGGAERPFTGGNVSTPAGPRPWLDLAGLAAYVARPSATVTFEGEHRR